MRAEISETKGKLVVMGQAAFRIIEAGVSRG
jgi:hypothetical protein